MAESNWADKIYLYSPEYKDVVHREIQRISEEKSSEVDLHDFKHLDILHPAEHVGIDLLLQEHPLDQSSYVLDIGCGMGGTSRYLTHTTQCRVLGVDFLQHFTELGTEISSICGYEDSHRFVSGDIKTVELPQSEFDLGIAVGVFLMIEGDEGFRNIYSGLKPGGFFYFEDYYLTKEREELSEETLKMTIEDWVMPGIRSRSQLVSQLQSVGFEISKDEEFGHVWSEYAWSRSQKILEEQKRRDFPDDEMLNRKVKEYGIHSPQILCKLDHLTPEELRERYPLTCEAVNCMEYVYNPNNPIGVIRLIARKPF